MESDRPLLEARGLSKSYRLRGGGREGLAVIESLDLRLEAGERVAIQGESGVGKTTLLNILGGLDRPDSGILLYQGREIPAAPGPRARWRRQAVGIVFQFHGLLAELSALENVALAGLVAGWDLPQATAGASEMLEELGLASRAGHHPDQLSGGEQQRVAIARALLIRPPLVLADEPTGNLDPRTGDRVFDLLVRLQRGRRFALLVATHSDRLARGCHRVLRMEQGGLRPTGETPGAPAASDP